MLSYIKKKIDKYRQKKTFQEYGYEIKKFNLSKEGEVAYAQWLHPFEEPQVISQSQVNFYRKFIKKGDLLIDIGAHTGDTTIPMALAASDGGLVLALEPNAYVYKILAVNAELNPAFGKIIPLPFAATENDGEFTFHYSDASFCNGGFLSNVKNQRHNHNYTLNVQGKNLEKYLRENFSTYLPNLSLLKVDAEGYDKEILKNMANIIKQSRPFILAECYKHLDREERVELYWSMATHNYAVFYLDSFEEKLITEKLTEEDMLKRKHFEIVAAPIEKQSVITD